MANFKQIEEDVVNATKEVLAKAEQAEPTIAQAVQAALEGAGVPAPLAVTATQLVESLLAHFAAPPAAQPAPAQAVPAEAAVPAVPEAVPEAVPAEAEAANPTQPTEPAEGTSAF